ncbi:MAG: type II secretion system protein [Candidatus Gracilibacteria bacterium]|jgi:prepilin-type N-terminal cleavage/methylation domain-containing protein|nr:type II secretion system protein [Candidatus Gracilibacteria bacterium]
MKEIFKNLVLNTKSNKGFTLTEVLIGMMILTIAIVTATNILVGLINTNKNVVQVQQAYFLAIEGVEAVRNIRDTNWLNNVDFRGRLDLLGMLENGSEMVVGLNSMAWKSSVKSSGSDISRFKTWNMSLKSGDNDKLCVFDEDGGQYFGLCEGVFGKDSGFRRVVKIEPYCDTAGKSLCVDSFKVESIVSYFDSDKEKFVSLSAVLTDWKGGAL